MINLFTKATILNSLQDKVKLKEIKSFQLTDEYLHIKKSKRSNYTIQLDSLPQNILIRLLKKKIPDPGIINTPDFFKVEIRNLKLKLLL